MDISTTRLCLRRRMRVPNILLYAYLVLGHGLSQGSKDKAKNAETSWKSTKLESFVKAIERRARSPQAVLIWQPTPEHENFRLVSSYLV